MVETLLHGNCDPNEFGRPEISPLSSALRIMDTAVVAYLLYGADPNRAARGEDLPIFTAIARQNVPAVQSLVAARANLQVRGYARTPGNSRFTHAGPRWVGHTPLEMANGHNAITRELLAAECMDEQEQPPDKADWER